jgi:glutathione S-transferase
MHTATIIGGPISPYARKVMAIADLKRVRWRNDPIIPFQGNDEFTRISPLRRIPVFIDDQVTLADSTAIGEYLDERYPTPPLFPAGPAARARARWLEEFADTRMGDVFIWRIFNPAVIVPGVWKQPRDDAAIAATLRDELPSVMDYLESVAPEDGFVCGALAIADIAIAAFFANLRWSRTGVDLAAWPRTMAWIARVEQIAAIARLTTLAERALTTRGAERQALFGDMGVELTETSYAGKGFRKGPMSV